MGRNWQVGKPQTIDWNYASSGHLRESKLMKNGSVVRSIAKAAKICQWQ
jgi:hypothetical protein